MTRVPLAEEMRPKSLDEVIGQSHLLAKGEILRQIVKSQEPVSLILWGPPGTGKTTLARIIANEVKAEFIELSAVTAGKKDVLQVVEHAKQNWNLGLRTILFVDEIHRFNKAQQDAFLPHVESGLVTLIGATTENPSFEIITPLLSRSRVLVLQPLTKDEIKEVVNRALKVLKKTKSVTVYTARPRKDREAIQKLVDKGLFFKNIFVTTSFEEAEGYAYELASNETRDIWFLRIDQKHLIETLNANGVRNYQTFSSKEEYVPIIEGNLI